MNWAHWCGVRINRANERGIRIDRAHRYWIRINRVHRYQVRMGRGMNWRKSIHPQYQHRQKRVAGQIDRVESRLIQT